MKPIERVKDFLKKQEIKLEVIEFPEGATETCELAAQALGVLPAQIAKTLVFVGKKSNVLVVTCGDERVDQKKLKEYIGDKFRFARGEEVEELTGFPPGGVCPFALKSELPIIIDKSIERYPVVYTAAGNAGSAVPVTLEQLLEVTHGKLLSVCGEWVEKRA
ncbi:MAG: prolyl-tRNA synthetase [Peptococcaceae bacterium BICA1-8]|nr:MAG: prolyl-tRNA synthetase [Peptococcaceae bacterium BICA1-8]KJS86755.1 MAG: prolyl-tRNA synthetase [Peptococcaceae bacterium BICA1-8]